MFPHNLLTHNLITTKLAHHTTCSHTSCSHTTYSPHNLLTTQLAHHTTCSPHSLLAHNLLTHNLLTHNMFTHTTCSHTHNMFTHILLTHTMFTHTVADTQLTHTQLTHTQLAHTQLAHTQLTHTQLTHRDHTHNMFTHNCWHTTYSHTHNLLTHTAYSPHNLLTTQLAHRQLAHTQLTTQLAHHTACSHTTCSHTTYSHTTCSHTTCSHTTCPHASYSHSGRRGAYGTGLALVARLSLSWRRGCRGRLRGRRGTWRHGPLLCLASVALGDMDRHFAWQAWDLRHWAFSGGALGSELTPWAPWQFAWQAWHLATWTVTLPGKRGTWRHGRALCVAGVALGDTHRHFSWQAWHLATWTVTLPGRCGTYGTGLALVARLGLSWRRGRRGRLRGRRGTWRHGPLLCLAGVALGDMDVHFAWQAWHLRHWAGLWWRPFHCCTRRSFTIFFLFPAFPIPSFYLSFAAYWKKLTCGVIRSCNCCFCCSSLRAIDTGGKRLITTYVTYDYISPRFPVLFLSLVAGCIWLFRLVDLRHISLDKISGI